MPGLSLEVASRFVPTSYGDRPCRSSQSGRPGKIQKITGPPIPDNPTCHVETNFPMRRVHPIRTVKRVIPRAWSSKMKPPEPRRRGRHSSGSIVWGNKSKWVINHPDGVGSRRDPYRSSPESDEAWLRTGGVLTSAGLFRLRGEARRLSGVQEDELVAGQVLLDVCRGGQSGERGGEGVVELLADQDVR